MTPITMKQIVMTVNRQPVTASVEPRLSLADFLRERLQLTGAHLGCEQLGDSHIFLAIC